MKHSPARNRHVNRGGKPHQKPHNPHKHHISQGTKTIQNKGEEKIYTGILSVNSRGAGFVTVDELEHDIEIPEGSLGVAFHRDVVRVSTRGQTGLPRRGEKKGRLQGRVLEITTRTKTRFVGTVGTYGNKRVIIADDKRIHVPFEAPSLPASSTKVFFELANWTDSQRLPEALIIRVLGQKGDNDVEMESIVLERGFNATFDPEVVAEAESIRENAPENFKNEIPNRRDFRNTPTFTIDPADAKDFDDALSFKKLSNGNFELGVHIADVAHFVRPGSLLDRESQKRGVSIYLVDRTIPMLPEALSADLCSLKPNEDKLTFSAVFEMTGEGEVKNRWFGRSIIHSVRRFTYEEAQEVIESGVGDFSKELPFLNTVAKKILAERFRNGAISFEQDEVKFELDEKGRPMRVFRKQRKDAHKLIEEYMLLANREVATYVEHLHKNKKTTPLFVYRIHDFPNPEKITELGIFLKAVGYELKMAAGKTSARDINALFKQIEGEAEEGMIKTAAIRSMAKAIYSTKNIGHFGLGFEYYTHFTSPIRRYADVLVHRLLHEYLSGRSVSTQEFAFYENMSTRVTENEIRATEAERDSIKLKQVEYMSERIGKTFEGIISGVTEWGLYVEDKETKCEGMVKVRDLGDDYYTLDKKNYCLTGERTKKKYSLGDSMRFKVVGADTERKTLDYALA